MKRFALLCCLALALAGCKHSLDETEKLRAGNAAHDWFDKDGSKSMGCSGIDSDGDSYVTCTGTKADGTSEALLCSYAANPGCKPKT